MNIYVYIEYISFYMYYFIAIYLQTHTNMTWTKLYGYLLLFYMQLLLIKLCVTALLKNNLTQTIHYYSLIHKIVKTMTKSDRSPGHWCVNSWYQIFMVTFKDYKPLFPWQSFRLTCTITKFLLLGRLFQEVMFDGMQKRCSLMN